MQKLMQFKETFIDKAFNRSFYTNCWTKTIQFINKMLIKAFRNSR